MFRVTDEVEKKWSVEDKLIEECYISVAEKRDVDSGDDILQVLAIAFEIKLGESGEDNGSEGRRRSTFSVSPRSRESECEAELTESRQRSQTSNHGLG